MKATEVQLIDALLLARDQLELSDEDRFNPLTLPIIDAALAAAGVKVQKPTQLYIVTRAPKRPYDDHVTFVLITRAPSAKQALAMSGLLDENTRYTKPVAVPLELDRAYRF